MHRVVSLLRSVQSHRIRYLTASQVLASAENPDPALKVIDNHLQTQQS